MEPYDFSSHELRAGLIRKLSNLGMVAMANIIDAMLLGGLELDMQPVPEQEYGLRCQL